MLLEAAAYVVGYDPDAAIRLGGTAALLLVLSGREAADEPTEQVKLPGLAGG